MRARLDTFRSYFLTARHDTHDTHDTHNTRHTTRRDTLLIRRETWISIGPLCARNGSAPLPAFLCCSSWRCAPELERHF